MKRAFTALVVVAGVFSLGSVAQAAETCDDVFLLSVSYNMMPTRGGGWIKQREARFMRQADSVIIQMNLKPKQLSDNDLRITKYDHNPIFRLCSERGEVRVVPVPK